MTTPPVYDDARLKLIAINLTAELVGKRIIFPCMRQEFIRFVLGPMMRISSEYERKLRAKEDDLQMTMNLCRAFGAESDRQRTRIAELEQIVAAIPADTWPRMMEADDVHV